MLVADSSSSAPSSLWSSASLPRTTASAREPPRTPRAPLHLPREAQAIRPVLAAPVRPLPRAQLLPRARLIPRATLRSTTAHLLDRAEGGFANRPTVGRNPTSGLDYNCISNAPLFLDHVSSPWFIPCFVIYHPRSHMDFPPWYDGGDGSFTKLPSLVSLFAPSNLQLERHESKSNQTGVRLLWRDQGENKVKFSRLRLGLVVGIGFL